MALHHTLPSDNESVAETVAEIAEMLAIGCEGGEATYRYLGTSSETDEPMIVLRNGRRFKLQLWEEV